MEHDQAFGGVIGRYHFDSEPWWPPDLTAPPGAPNVLIVVLDDVGFAQLGCFGSDLETPGFDSLAGNGLRFTNFHTTSLCSPTRACVLTGRNHHAVGLGRITELATGFPGYNGRIPASTPFLSQVLRDAGWATFAVGKWHLTPEEDAHEAGSRARWPLGRGFERWYGFFGGETHQFAPALVCDNHQIETPRPWQEGYHLTEDLVDQAQGMIRNLRAVDATKPFFMYLCFGACHAPHQSPPEWLARFRGRFDDGWDAWRDATFARQLASGVIPEGTRLSARPEWVPAWADLSADERRLYARYMEAFAAFLAHADRHFTRFVDFLAESGELDNTVVVLLSDNGASSEGGPVGSTNDNRVWNFVPHTVEDALSRIDELGGPRMHNNYPWGWTVAGNTPFRRWKREVHEGGVADPLIVHWPRRIGAPGQLRRQYTHAVDVMPTLLELAGVTAPPNLDGASFARALDDPGAPEHRTTQYYEMFGCRAIYHDGWKAVVYHPIQFDRPGLDQVPWELYNVAADASETEDLAEREPDRLAELDRLWWAEAERNNVLPLDNRPLSDFVVPHPPARYDRNHYRYPPGAAPVPEAVAVNVRNRTHVVTADVIVPDGGSEGVVISQGSLLGGWVLFVVDGRLSYVHNLCNLEEHRVQARTPLLPGRHTLVFHFEKTGEHRGRGTLLVDGEAVGTGEIPRFTPNRFALAGAGLSVGRDASGLAVCDDYVAPFPFTGTIIGDVTVDVDGAAFVDPQGEAAIAVATQ
ncbi:MAG: arylsulfatase [Acidimicrobiia bacterium]|nr:arylsulfatase [Acidimicrobiia bacterium]